MAPHCTTCVEPLKDTSLRYKSAPANIKYAPHIRPVHIAVIALLLVVVSGIGLYLAHTKAEEQRAREAKRTALQATVQALQMAWDEVAHIAQILQMDRRGASQKRPVRSSARPDLWSDRDLRRIDIGDRPQGLKRKSSRACPGCLMLESRLPCYVRSFAGRVRETALEPPTVR